MSDKIKEYYHNGGYVTIVGGIEGQPDYVVVDEGGDYGSMLVARRKDLTPKEESYTWKRQLDREKELKDITKKAEENLNAVADKVVDRALNSLASRMKFNAVFGESDGGTTGWAVVVSNALKDMIKDKTKDTMKDFDL